MEGVGALFCIILYTLIWLWKVDPLTPYYGYWQGREDEFTLFETIKQILIYMFVFDAWFYATHRLLHLDWFMKHVHHWHHVLIMLFRNSMSHQLLRKMLCIHFKPFFKDLWDISLSPYCIQWILFSLQLWAISLLFMPFWLMMAECWT